MSRKRKSLKKSPYISLPIIVLSSLVIILAVFGIYLASTNSTLQEQTNNFKKEISRLKQQQEKFLKDQEDQVAKYFEEKTKDLEIEYIKPIDNMQYIHNPKKDESVKFIYDEQPKKEEKQQEIAEEYNTDIVKKEDTQEADPLKEKETPIQTEKVVQKSDLPKIAIIIDDVTNAKQVKSILDIGYDINMAFLPPTPRHQNSASIAQSLESYMIHLPLQASNFKYDEDNTLYVTDDISKIERRIKILSELYPKAKFINNHTGSKFTANKEAMDKLFSVLKKYDYIFIDSKTTAKSVAKEVGEKYGIRVLSRNIFLDNKKDKQYIQNQLKKAVDIAKKYGSAIAIGHPYSVTFEALEDSKELLKGVRPVFVDKL